MIAITILAAFAFAALVGTHVLLERRLVKLTKDLFAAEASRRTKLDELEEARTKLLYRQQKASVTVVERNNRAVTKLSDKVRDLHKNAVELHKSVERIVKAAETNG